MEKKEDKAGIDISSLSCKARAFSILNLIDIGENKSKEFGECVNKKINREESLMNSSLVERECQIGNQSVGKDEKNVYYENGGIYADSVTTSLMGYNWRSGSFSGGQSSNNGGLNVGEGSDEDSYQVKTSGSPSMENISCKLETMDLWNKFYKLGTEMIITKTGRRMFPTICVSFKNLEPYQLYALMLDIYQVDNKRYRYAYHRSSWLIAGKADTPNSKTTYLHPDGVQLGKNLMNRTISFEKLKLTNNANNGNGHIVLNSMHKYEPRIHIVKVNSTKKSSYTNWQKHEHRTFTFRKTIFIVVTAYQNQLITKLKINSNPFAKGFRDVQRGNMEKYCYNPHVKLNTSTIPYIMNPFNSFIKYSYLNSTNSNLINSHLSQNYNNFVNIMKNNILKTNSGNNTAQVAEPDMSSTLEKFETDKDSQ